MVSLDSATTGLRVPCQGHMFSKSNAHSPTHLPQRGQRSRDGPTHRPLLLPHTSFSTNIEVYVSPQID